MENKNVVVLKHHPMNVKFTNTFYTSQVDDDLADYEVIDVTSRITRNKEFMAMHPNFAKELSPFYIGPVVASDGEIANVFEHFWQCGKVYPCHFDFDKMELKPEFFEWRKRWFAKPKTVDKNETRHPNLELGYSAGDCIGNVYFENGKYRLLDYVESRKKLYFVEYAKATYNTDAFKYLKSLVDSGKKVAVVDFDAFNFYSENAMKQRYKSYLNNCKKNKWKPTLTERDFTNIKSLKDAINCKFLAAGHAFVLKAMLDGSIVVVNGKVIDKDGILK